MSDPGLIGAIIDAVTIPVMAKCRIGHFVEAQILQSLGVDYVDESEVLTPADEEHHINKHAFTVPFVCGCRDLGEALRRITEGAAMIRTKGEAGTGNVVEAVRHMRAVTGTIRRLTGMGPEELVMEAKRLGAPFDLLEETAKLGRLPVVNFAAGGIATPADAALNRNVRNRIVSGFTTFATTSIGASADPPALSMIIRAVICAAMTVSFGSTRRSNRYEASVLIPIRRAVLRMIPGSNHAHSSRTLRVESPISLSAPPITPPSATA